MHINLAQLDSETLELVLSPPGTPPEEQQHVRLSQVRGLSGQLSQSRDSLRLSSTHAKEALIDALRMAFGSAVLACAGQTRLSHVVARYERGHDQGEGAALQLQLMISTVTSPRVQLNVGTLMLAGNTRLDDCELSVNDQRGRLRARSCKLAAFLLDLGSVTLAARELSAERLEVCWGDGFQLSARNVVCTGVDFKAEGTELYAEQANAAELRVHDTDWVLAGLTLDQTKAELDLAASPSRLPAEPAISERGAAGYRPERPIFDWRILDRLSGRFDVDAAVDVRLPLIQGRRAVHEFRVLLERGTLSYRDLEHNLSTLEDALLDFSLRDDELVLELGVPLLPTRGLGKVLLRWPLSEQELGLAANERVRLATLARPRLARHAESETQTQAGARTSETGNGSVQLRRLVFENIRSELTLEKPEIPMEALLRSLAIGELNVQGALAYRSSSADAEVTRLQANLREIEIDLDDFPLAGRRFDLKNVHIDSVPKLELDMAGMRAVRLSLELEKLSSHALAFGKFARD